MDKKNSEDLMKPNNSNETSNMEFKKDSKDVTREASDYAISGADTNNSIIRQNMVETAAEFLQSIKHGSSDHINKHQFLSKKGLSNKEIEAAFKLTGITYNAAVSNDGANIASNSFSNVSIPQRYPHYPANNMATFHPWAAPSLWQRIRDLGNLAVFVFGAVRAAQYVYYRWIAPWLTGRSCEPPIEAQMMSLQSSVTDSLLLLQRTVQDLKNAVTLYTDKLQENKESNRVMTASVTLQMEQTKSEVSSLKGLLLNRRNFTTPPTVAVGLPAWQKKTAVSATTEPDNAATPVSTERADVVTPVVDAPNTETNVASVETNVASVETNVASVETNVASVETNDASIETNVASTEASVISNEASVVSNDASVVSTENDVSQETNVAVATSDTETEVSNVSVVKNNAISSDLTNGASQEGADIDLIAPSSPSSVSSFHSSSEDSSDLTKNISSDSLVDSSNEVVLNMASNISSEIESSFTKSNGFVQLIE